VIAKISALLILMLFLPVLPSPPDCSEKIVLLDIEHDENFEDIDDEMIEEDEDEGEEEHLIPICERRA
jgi:hypothetical protein